MTDQQAMAKTNRSKGAVGAKAVVPKWIRETHDPADGHRYLDYGSGRDALHTLTLQEAGFNCHAYEQECNRGPMHDEPAQLGAYDVVFASNVLNVQTSYTAIHAVLQDLRALLVLYGLAIFNMPNSPRKCACNRKALESMILNVFGEFEDITPKGYSGRMYCCIKANFRRREDD